MIVYLVGVLIVLIGFIIGALSLCKTVKEADVLEAELLSKETFSEDAFISGIEFAIDWQLEIPEEDFKRYNEIMERRRLENESKGDISSN